jgi:hypothetical protein
MRENMESGSGSGTGTGTGTSPASGTTLPANTYCPENYSFDNGQCKNKTTGQTIPATVCLVGQTWDGTKCAGSSSASAPPDTGSKQNYVNYSPSPVSGGYQPSETGKENFSPV